MVGEALLVITIFSLIGLNVWQHIFWSKQTQTLTDKLMSRNYQEYQNINNSVRAIDNKKAKVPDLPEDLRTLQNFQF